MAHRTAARSPHDRGQQDPVIRPRRRRAVWADRIAASDLGFARLRLALQAGLSVALVLWAEWLLIHYTHALQMPAPVPIAELPPLIAARLAFQHHAIIVIAMLLGTFMTVVAATGLPNEDVRSQFIGLAAMAPPFVGGFALAIEVGGHRTGSLTLVVVLLGLGTYAWRFGFFGLVFGVMVPSGFLIGYFLRAEFSLSDLGWVTAAVSIGLGACLLVRLAAFFPSRTRALRRFERSFIGSARLAGDLIAAAIEGHGDLPPVKRRRLECLVLRMNEAALHLDARLAAGRFRRGIAGSQLHAGLFDAELALSAMARAVTSLNWASLPAGADYQVRRAVAALRQGNLDVAQEAGQWLRRSGSELLAADSADDAVQTGTALRRLGAAVQALAAALPCWHDAWTAGSLEDVPQPLRSPVRLVGSWLPGSALVSAATAARFAGNSGAPGRRLRLDPAFRVPIQMTVAVTVALVAGDALSPDRFYWAVIAVPVILIGTYNVSEQVTKAVFRTAGTVVGVLVGGLLAHAVGQRDGWAIAVVIAALTVGHYLMRANYVFLIMGVTVALSQLYEQLGEYSNHLLATRLEETAIGSGAAILVVALVVPLYTRRVMRAAAEQHQAAVTTLAEARQTEGAVVHAELRHAARALDDAHQAMLATARPLRHVGLLVPPAAGAARSAEPLTASYRDARTHLADAVLADAVAAGTRRAPERRQCRQAAARRQTRSSGQPVRTREAGRPGPSAGAHARPAVAARARRAG